jgi:hypothetical protein
VTYVIDDTKQSKAVRPIDQQIKAKTKAGEEERREKRRQTDRGGN